MSEQPKRPPKPTQSALADHAPWKPSEWEPEDAGALQALMRGDAADHQQKRALQFIIERLCGTYEPAFRPADDGRRDTDFALGKAYVGQQIVKLLKVNLSRLRGRPSEQP